MQQGDLKNGLELLEQVKTEAKKPHSFQAHSYLFLALVGLNRFDEAFDWLDNTLKMKSSILMLTFSDPLSEKIRNDNRFISYEKRMYKVTKPRTSETQKTPLLDEQTVAEYSTALYNFLEMKSHTSTPLFL